MTLALFPLSACAVPNTGVQACPPGTQSIAVWSSEDSPDSKLQFVGSDSVISSSSVDVQGIGASQPAVTLGNKTYLLARGNRDADKSSLLEVDLGSCRARVVPLQGHGVLGMDVSTDMAIVTIAPTSGSELYRYDLGGNLKKKVTMGGTFITNLVIDGAAVYAFSLNDSGMSVDLLVLDAETLTVRNQIPLPGVGSSIRSAVVHGETLYFPLTLINEKEGGEDHRLGLVDLKTLTLQTVDLKESSPYLVVQNQDSLLVGHTFMNPAIRNLSEYRHVSTVSWQGNVVAGAELGLGIRTMAVSENNLVILGVDAQDRYFAGTYKLPELTRVSEVALGASDQWGGYHYAAAVVPLPAA